MHKIHLYTCAAIVVATAAPQSAPACACGCGVFDVGTSAMLPTSAGGMAFLDYFYQDQNRNWSGNSRAPAANNSDQEIRTTFITPTLQYFFNRSWGIEAEIPVVNRDFKTIGGASGHDIVNLNWWALGDIKLNALYTGFSPDMSSGLSFGVKLPTGGFHHNDPFGDIDRDTEIGSGSTDVLLGGFHRGYLPGDLGVVWFAQAQLDVPVFTQEQYRPGLEVDAAAGLYYNRLHIGRLKISPIAQVIGSYRASDSGANAAGGANDDPGDIASGYQRVLLSPGIELDLHPWRFYADAEFPVYQQVTGNQLIANQLFKVSVSYMF